MNYICKADDEVTVMPFEGFKIRCPKYETDLDTLMVEAHIECYKRHDGAVDIQVWAIITNTKFRWYVMEYTAKRNPDVPDAKEATETSTESLFWHVVDHLNASKEFDRGMRRAVAECKAMLDRLAL